MRLTSLFVISLAAFGCGSTGSSPAPTSDATAAVDAIALGGGDATTDAGARADVRADASRDAGSSTADLPPSTAGNPCTADGQCTGGLTCDTESFGGYCTNDCTDNPDPANEARQCGGRGATCLTWDEDPATAEPFCARACDPEARTESAGACRAGYYCTGFWFWRESGEPDAPGCVAFCDSDSQCGAGMRCNTRTGYCNAEGVVTSRRADGEPCNPMRVNDDDESLDCRGFCILSSDADRTHGICASEINLRTTNMCPDNPSAVLALAAFDEDDRRLDNSGVCAWRNCTTSADCTAPLRCIDPGDGSASYCDWPETGTEVRADAGVRDAARD